MIRHSDTVNSMLTGQAHAIVLRRVALTTLSDARAAWKRARERPNEKRTEAAYRACVLAARMLRKAAAAIPREAKQMLEAATRIESTGDELKAQLVSMLEASADPGTVR